MKGLDLKRRAAPVSIYIFGVTGDLTRSKLIPALFSLYTKGNLNQFKIFGFARRPWGNKGLREKASRMLSGFSGVSQEVKEAFLSRLFYIQSEFQSPEGYRQIGTEEGNCRNRLYYLATPPQAYEEIITKLGEFDLNGTEDGAYTRIVVEKPFGKDLASARELNRLLSRYFHEEQVYRIDHYLGKETVQNIMLFRFGNGIFEPFWNNRYVDHIQITVAEKGGVGTRGNYYEKAGTLRDMVQNHVFQLLSLTAMEAPNDLSAESIRGEKVKIIRALDPISYDRVDSQTVRGQYRAGTLDGEQVPGYLEEEGVDPESLTETFAALKVYLNTWRWAGIPIYLRSGKRLSRKLSEISLHFSKPPLEIFKRSGSGLNNNTLIIRIQPEEGITLNFNAKVPGYQNIMRPVNMDFSYGSAFGAERPEAYERLLLDVMTGDSTLYTRRDEIEASWAFITRILRGWERSGSRPAAYAPGSSGPPEAASLFPKGSGRWRKI
jgi:glucose-6-phosphate 1-dehydrogenase